MKPMLPEFGRCGELFQTPSGTAFADIPVNEHRETWPIRSKRFRSWLRRCHYEAPSVGCRLRNRRLAAGTLCASMAANRTAAIESIIEADPLAAACAR